MKKSLSGVVVASVAMFGIVSSSGASHALAAPVRPGIQEAHERRENVHHDRSAPLREIPPAAPLPPRVEGADTGLPLAAPTGAPDPVIQGQPGIQIPASSTNFAGVGNGFTGPQGAFSVQSAPPDTNGAVGPNHYVQVVNSSFAVFNKTGTALYGPVAINTLWSGFGGGCQANNDGDPVVNYDRISDRWMISQFSVSTTPYLQCVAVSQTADPLGAYYRYSFQYTNFPDYPKMSVWPDAYYVTFNMFAGGSSFAGAEACAYDRTKMLVGASATQQCFSTSTAFGGLLPSDLDGTQLPPAGSPNYIVGLGASANQLASWNFHVDFAVPGNTTFTGPATISTAAFSPLCGGGHCIPQSGTTQTLDSLADRLMFRLAYRNFGDHEALVVTHSVAAGTGGGVRWYELRPNAGVLSIFQQGTYAPDASYRWMGSAAMDHSGDIGLGFSVSSSTTHPGIHYTGRLATDALGVMGQGEGVLIDGAGSQTGTLERWGDYSAMTVDPTDDCTFWYTNEFIPANGSFNWSTRIGSFKFASCGAPTNDFSINAAPTTLTVSPGSSASTTINTTITSGSSQALFLSATGLPTGVTASFTPASISSGASSTLTLTASPTAASTTAAITITGTGTSATRTTAVSLTINPTSIDPIQNGRFESGTLTPWTTTGTVSLVASGHTGVSAAQLGSTTPTIGDSTLSQSFTAPAVGGKLNFFYKVICPDVVANDWATATLRDTTTNTTATLFAKKCTNAGTWTKLVKAVIGAHSYTLTITNHDNNNAATATRTLVDDAAVVFNPVVNPGFETGDFNGWSTTGATSVVTAPHLGTFAAQAGATTATNGDSTIAQTFTLPTGSTTLSFFYKMTCTDTVTFDWVTATLIDNTTGLTTTMLTKRCVTNTAFAKAALNVTALVGHSLTLVLTGHDDNSAADPSHVVFDDINLV